MEEMLRSISGDDSLNDIEQAIAGAEATGMELLRYRISDDEITNIITFNDLPPGERPEKRLLLVPQGNPVPSGTTIVYDGVLLVSGNETGVSAYR